MASRWEGVRLPRKFPELPLGSFSVTSPEVLSLWNLTAIQRFPGSFPDFPGSLPDFPGSLPDFPGSLPDFPRGRPLSLGSLTPSPDSQKLSLNRVGSSPRTLRSIFVFRKIQNLKTMAARDSALFSLPGHRALFSTFWCDFFPKLHRRSGEREKSTGKIQKNPVD